MVRCFCYLDRGAVPSRRGRTDAPFQAAAASRCASPQAMAAARAMGSGEGANQVYFSASSRNAVGDRSTHLKVRSKSVSHEVAWTSDAAAGDGAASASFPFAPGRSTRTAHRVCRPAVVSPMPAQSNTLARGLRWPPSGSPYPDVLPDLSPSNSSALLLDRSLFITSPASHGQQRANIINA